MTLSGPDFKLYSFTHTALLDQPSRRLFIISQPFSFPLFIILTSALKPLPLPMGFYH
jgi:hypothetical protein